MERSGGKSLIGQMLDQMLVKLPRAGRHVVKRRARASPSLKNSGHAGNRLKGPQESVGQKCPFNGHVRMLQCVVNIRNDGQSGRRKQIVSAASHRWCSGTADVQRQQGRLSERWRRMLANLLRINPDDTLK